MARASPKIIVPTPTEQLIVRTLKRSIPAACVSYQQCLLDLHDKSRLSYRGVAHELREVLRETLDYLAPSADVMAESGFKLDEGQKRPTQKQKALYILRKRKLSREQISAPELTISMVEEIGSSIARTAYNRGSKNAHTNSSSADVRQLKMYIDAVLAELLEIHSRSK